MASPRLLPKTGSTPARSRSPAPFSKPRKEAISLRLDADVLDWLRHRSERHQAEINRILRETMEAEAHR